MSDTNNKPREFWIGYFSGDLSSDNKFYHVYEKEPDGCWGDNYHETYHVIEYESYEKLKEELKFSESDLAAMVNNKVKAVKKLTELQKLYDAEKERAESNAKVHNVTCPFADCRREFGFDLSGKDPRKGTWFVDNGQTPKTAKQLKNEYDQLKFQAEKLATALESAKETDYYGNCFIKTERLYEALSHWADYLNAQGKEK